MVFRGTLSGTNATLLFDAEASTTRISIRKSGSLALKNSISWSGSLPLKKGVNRIFFLARNAFGQTANKTIRVVRNGKPSRKPAKTTR